MKRSVYDKQLMKWAKDHYWDSFEKDKHLILRHLRTFVRSFIMNVCKQCQHHNFYKMITDGPYGYAGPIPCQRCSRFSVTQDNFEPINSAPNKIDSPDPTLDRVCHRCKTEYKNWEDAARCCEGR